jgi:hypothetical protein
MTTTREPPTRSSSAVNMRPRAGWTRHAEEFEVTRQADEALRLSGLGQVHEAALDGGHLFK